LLAQLPRTTQNAIHEAVEAGESAAAEVTVEPDELAPDDRIELFGRESAEQVDRHAHLCDESAARRAVSEMCLESTAVRRVEGTFEVVGHQLDCCAALGRFATAVEPVAQIVEDAHARQSRRTSGRFTDVAEVTGVVVAGARRRS
jgi:hypothetical protein